MPTPNHGRWAVPGRQATLKVIVKLAKPLLLTVSSGLLKIMLKQLIYKKGSKDKLQIYKNSNIFIFVGATVPQATQVFAVKPMLMIVKETSAW